MLQLPRWLIRYGFGLYPPYLGAGVRVRRISPDWHEMEISMKLRWYNRNIVGVHFGGSLYSMADPHYVLLLMKNLGADYVVWDREARIEFLRPGHSEVHATVRIDKEQIEQIRRQTEDGSACRPEFTLEILDDRDEIVARVHKALHIRKKPNSGRTQ